MDSNPYQSPREPIDAAEKPLRNFRQMAKWERIRKKGRGRFIFWYGVIGYGCGFATVMSVVQAYVSSDLSSIWGAITFYWLFAPIGGSALGAFMWWYSEEQYRTFMAQVNDQAKRGFGKHR